MEAEYSKFLRNTSLAQTIDVRHTCSKFGITAIKTGKLQPDTAKLMYGAFVDDILLETAINLSGPDIDNGWLEHCCLGGLSLEASGLALLFCSLMSIHG